MAQCGARIGFQQNKEIVPRGRGASIPFCALKVGEHFLIEKAFVAQASSLRTLNCARVRWLAICDDAEPSSEAGQALMVMHDDFDVLKSLEEQCAELVQVVQAETLSDSDVSKANVIKRVVKGSASLVHFLVHRTPGGRGRSALVRRGVGFFFFFKKSSLFCKYNRKCNTCAPLSHCCFLVCKPTQ